MHKVFHGWKMVAAGGLMQFLLAALLHQAFGAYFALLTDEFGWSKTALAFAAVLQPMEAALLGPVLGWFIDRFGPQGMIRIGVITLGTGFFALSTIDTLTGFYAAFFVIALGSSLCGFFPINVAIIHWFEKKRARALSLLTLGLAFGGMAMPLVALAMQSYGWRAAALGSGVIVILCGWPIASIFRGKPETLGEFVDGEPPTLGGEREIATPRREFSVAEALRTRAFWMISLGHGFALLIVYAVSVHAIAHMKEGLGFSIAQASLVITLMTAAQIGGVLLGSVIGDRYDKRRIAAACMLMHGLGLALLTFASGPAMLAAFAILHGCAWGLRGPLMQALRADFFGRRSIGMILGISSVILTIGQIGGPMIAAIMADLTGDYRAGFSGLAVAAVLGALFFLLARRPV